MAAIIALFLSWIPVPSLAQPGASCHDGGDCLHGHCMCVGGPDGMLSFPNPRDRAELRGLDGKPAAGACLDHRLPPGAWFCEVVHGKADFAGIIVD